MTVTADPLLTVDELSFRYPARPMFDGWSARFGPGLHWVRGPNGSGKSNLLEALRWSMGATSARAMRGGEMDDLIFSGSNPSNSSRMVSRLRRMVIQESPAWWPSS